MFLILAMAKQSLCTDYIKYIEGGCVELIILAQSSNPFPRGEEHANKKREDFQQHRATNFVLKLSKKGRHSGSSSICTNLTVVYLINKEFGQG